MNPCSTQRGRVLVLSFLLLKCCKIYYKPYGSELVEKVLLIFWKMQFWLHNVVQTIKQAKPLIGSKMYSGNEAQS